MIIQRTQREIPFQNHIINSYRLHGGDAHKWASEWQKGKPDLICCLPWIGLHLLEIKHEPDLGSKFKTRMPNSLSKKQVDVAKKLIVGGARVYAAVVFGSARAIGSGLAIFDPTLPEFNLETAPWVEYTIGQGFDVKWLMERVKTEIVLPTAEKAL